VLGEDDARARRLGGKLDRVLVDAPCSGFGTLRRNPDLKWRHNADAIAELSAKQRAILDAAARLVKPGGRLVYATCSILHEENDAVADAFQASRAEFRPVSAASLLAGQRIALDTGERLRLWPHLHDTDGFFAAVFERTTSAQEPKLPHRQRSK
jgi:16S rRNA (cytosine967-C5)-methyltransferase